MKPSPTPEVFEEPASKSRETLRLWLHLLRTTKHIEKQLDKELQNSFNCSLSRFDLLAVLTRHNPEGVLMKDLSRMLKVSNGNITGLIKKMEQENLVQALKKPNNNRNTYIFLKKKGLQLFEELADHHSNILQHHLSFLPNDEIQLLISKLKLIHSRY